MAASSHPIELLPIFRERVWGRHDLSPYFALPPAKNPIGEVWFTADENPTSVGKSLGEVLANHPEMLGTGANPRYPGVCPLLVKLLFTTERLSVQVHPDDEYAAAHHKSLGKTEAWYILDAKPPGELATGLRETLMPEQFRQAVETGEIESLLDWRSVRPGDVIFTPAGTVHAIGAGLTLCEIQENSDITYRLYDYGRPRELHLERGIAVSHLGPHTFKADPIQLARWRTHLLESPYFRIERLRPGKRIRFAAGSPFYMLLICTKGSGEIGGQPFTAGRTWLLPANGDEFYLNGPGSEWILTYTAAQPASTLQESA